MGDSVDKVDISGDPDASSDYITMTRYILQEEQKVTGTTWEFSQLLIAIQTAVKTIAASLRKEGAAQLYAMGFTETIKMNDFKRMEILAHQLFVKLLNNNTCCLILSKNSEDVVEIDPEMQGKYLVTILPLYGQYLDCASPLSTTFSIMRRTDEKLTDKQFYVPGRSITCAGYAIYGSLTTMVISIGKGHGVNGFTLDPRNGEFILTDSNIKIPKDLRFYSINEGQAYLWDKAIVDYFKNKKSIRDNCFVESRYVSNMAINVHRMLKKGGIYFNPANRELPFGALKLIYECFPMAFLIEGAGGAASDGTMHILDRVPTKLHERSPFFSGSKRLVKEVCQYIENSD